MRCKNCGWQNADGLTKCEKCNTPLQEGVKDQPNVETAVESDAPISPLRKTVCENEIFPQGNNLCPNCGYPMRPGVTVCPNCSKKETKLENPVEVKQEINKPINQVKVSPMNGTVNPWVQVAPINKCRLEPMEQHGVETPNVLSLKGDCHELNRANLDPDNSTITSKVQAELVCEDGTWYIQDKSAQQTTFIYAKEKTALKDGDVVLMGNRQFVFRTE